jgi:hypothetical protein
MENGSSLLITRYSIFDIRYSGFGIRESGIGIGSDGSRLTETRPANGKFLDLFPWPDYTPFLGIIGLIRYYVKQAPFCDGHFGIPALPGFPQGG